MINLLNASVTKNMIGASTYMKMGNVAMGIYKQAENKGDTKTMKRALGYADNSMNVADQCKEDAKDALETAQKQATKQEKAQQEANIKKKTEKASRINELKQKAEMEERIKNSQQTNSQTAGNATPTDTIEISNDGKATAQEIEQQATVEMSIQDIKIDVHPEFNDTQLSEPKIYTPNGDIKPESTVATISVLA